MKRDAPLALLLLSLLAGCVSEPADYQAAMTPRAEQAASLVRVRPATIAAPPGSLTRARAPLVSTLTPLHYYAWVNSATLEELQAERLRLGSRERFWLNERQRLEQGEADPVVDAVQLGMLLSVSALASPETEQEARTLLESAGDPAQASAASRDYAIFAGFLLGHLEQAWQLRAATSSVVESREKLEQLEHTNRELQQTIEALTSIEEQLIEREQAQETPAEESPAEVPAEAVQ